MVWLRRRVPDSRGETGTFVREEEEKKKPYRNPFLWMLEVLGANRAPGRAGWP